MQSSEVLRTWFENILFKLIMQSLATLTNPPKLDSLLAAGGIILQHFQRGQKVSAHQLKTILTGVFGSSDADGYWQWKDAYEAIEIALVRLLISRLRNNSINAIGDLIALENLYPAHNKRTEKSIRLQQFSTPITISYLANLAAQVGDRDLILEPSAGNGMLAVFAAMKCYDLFLNEIDPQRAQVLESIFSEAEVSSHNGEQINDRLDPKLKPTVVLINPPFSSYLNRDTLNSAAAYEHLSSSLERLQPNGRLVLISQEGLRSNNPVWTHRFVQLQESARIIFSAGIVGKAYRKQGTTVNTRMTVIEKLPAESATVFPEVLPCLEIEELARRINQLPPRLLKASSPPVAITQGSLFNLGTVPKLATVIPFPQARKLSIPQQKIEVEAKVKITWDNVESLRYEAAPQVSETTNVSGQFAPYQIQGIRIPQSQSHPSATVESLAMASIPAPVCSYRPLLPKELVDRGLLSDIQLETVIRAGEAHQKYLEKWIKEEANGKMIHYPYDEPGADRERQGLLLGDGTGIGKGRQIAAVILDNWLHGRTKAVWISISGDLIDASRRDWEDLGGDTRKIVAQNQYKPNQDIKVAEGILFTTYSTLRQPKTDKNQARLDQIINWLGVDFDGAVIFDECHAMGGAASVKGQRGATKASKQGLAGLSLQHRLPDARIMYVSATGASRIENLGYAERLGLWGTRNSAFKHRKSFTESIGNSGIAALEITSRELKAQGFYLARSLSYYGIEYQHLEHQLTPDQVEIYNKYAEAFEIIHNNIEAALKSTGATSSRLGGSSAYSSFESAKQRFFNQLLISMSCPSLIRAIEADLEAGYAPILQITSTNESMLNSVLQEIPVSEWHDLDVDISPKRYILDFLNSAFPIYLQEEHEVEGQTYTTDALDSEGQKIINQVAFALKEQLLAEILDLPSIHSALDQIIFYFGTALVAEVTGRSQRLIQYESEENEVKMKAKKRGKNSNLLEVRKFMNDEKQILVFSKAGGTGASYHADLKAKNQRLRKHYLIEPGWNAADAIQGFGRSHRANQKQPPVYTLVSTNVKGQKRFTSSIASRLADLGAITKGQADTGNNGLFSAEDSLNNEYARSALTDLIRDCKYDLLPQCSFQTLEQKTGLTLARDGNLVPTPPINRFLNRLLALEVDLQNYLFDQLDRRIRQNIAEAKAKGIYQEGVKTTIADSLSVGRQFELWQDPDSKAVTLVNQVFQKDRCEYLSVSDAMAEIAEYPNAKMVYSTQQDRVVYTIHSSDSSDPKTGKVIKYIRVISPEADLRRRLESFEKQDWSEIAEPEFRRLWQKQINELPEFEESEYYIVTGLLLPIWDRLKGYLKIQRVVTDDGQVLLGRYIHKSMIQGIIREFDRNIEMTPEEVYLEVDSGGNTKLKNGLRIALARVMYEHRIEIFGWNQNQLQVLIGYGCFEERINWQQRLFLPHDQKAAIPILEKIMQHS